MDKIQEKNKLGTKEEYTVKYFFDKNAKTNLNEILKKSFLLSLNAEKK